MRRNRDSGYFGHIVFIVFVLYLSFVGIYNLIYSDDIDSAEKKELADYWSQSTIDYFKSIKCSDLHYSKDNISIKKFVLIQSYLNKDCELSKFLSHDFDSIKLLKPYYTRKIDEANVIVWINIIGTNTAGNYADGSTAIRLKAEINFIDKIKKNIYKKIDIPFDGEPLQEISRKRGEKPNNVYFGDRPNFKIKNAILNQILSK